MEPEDDNATELLPEHVREKLPALYATEHTPDPLVIVKFFTPWTSWTWYATEGGPEEDGEFLFFGLVDGHEKELGYVSLNELEGIRGPGGLTIEKDLFFKEQPLSTSSTKSSCI